MVQSYFESEKKAAFVLLALGLLACSVASGFFISAQPPFYMGLALPFAAIGVYEVIVGTNLARSSDFQVFDLQKLLSSDPKAFVELEAPRLEKFLRNVKYFKIFGSILFLTGFFLMIFNKKEGFWQGVGCALEFQGVIVQMFYFFAERRAKKYAAFVEDLVQK
jgi:hypothetical protein